MRNVIASNGRFRFVVFGIVFCFLAVVARLAWLQLIAPEKYIKEAKEAHAALGVMLARAECKEG